MANHRWREKVFSNACGIKSIINKTETEAMTIPLVNLALREIKSLIKKVKDTHIVIPVIKDKEHT